MSTTKSSVLIVGGNRGIGYNIVQEELKKPDVRIFVTARRPAQADELNTLVSRHSGRIEVLQLDIDSEPSVTSFAAELGKHTSSLDTVWLVSGVMIGGASVDQVTADSLKTNFHSNVIGAHLVAKAVAPFLIKSNGPDPSLVFFNTGLSSLGKFDYISDWVTKATHVPEREDLAYALSKTALSSLTLFWRSHLKDRGVKVVSVHPGFVKTELWQGQDEGFDQSQMITPDQSAVALVKLLPTIDKEKTGSGLHFYDGAVVPF